MYDVKVGSCSISASAVSLAQRLNCGVSLQVSICLVFFFLKKNLKLFQNLQEGGDHSFHRCKVLPQLSGFLSQLLSALLHWCP